MSFLRNLFSRRSETAAAVLPTAASPSASSRPEPVPAPAVAREDCIDLPLKAITDLFPEALKAALRKHPSEHIHAQIPRALIRPQLASGAVRITFAQLRAGAPEIFFHPDAVPADTRVLLPLEAIVRQMTPSRREDQRQPEIPVNIPSVFQKSGPPSPVAAKAKADPWYSQRRPAYEAPPEPQPVPAPAAEQVKKPFQPLASITERPRRETPEPAAPDSVSIPLSAVLAALPQEIRHALNGSEAQSAAFIIPLAEIEARLRTGKAVFKWAQLRDWCNTLLTAPVAPDTDIDLPLPIVAPLFMAARTAPDTRKQITVDVRIPDVFGKAKPATTTPIPPQPAPAEPAPARPSNPATAPLPAQPAPSAVVAPITPAQIIQRLREVPGVKGAFIATADGLLVSGDVPDANENALAAFAPTVFAQLTKYSDMARLGQPQTIDVHLSGGSAVHVRRVGKLFLGILFPAGTTLPADDLSRISAALQPS